MFFVGVGIEFGVMNRLFIMLNWKLRFWSMLWKGVE